ncbi:MAG: FG-GAP repeat protein, partial [Thermoplasmatales archaeon]
MKTKIIGFIVSLLLITFSVISTAAEINNDEEIREQTNDYTNLKKQVTGKSNILDYWTEQEKLQSSDGSPGDYFGSSVEIYGDYAIVGAYQENDDTGSAYVYRRDGESWIEEQKLTASDGEPGDNFGKSVSIFENLVIVGAPGDDSKTGSAYLFNNSGSSWIEERKLIASDGEPDDLFGSAVSINLRIAVVGAYADDNFKGSVYAFNYSTTNNTEFIKLEAMDGETGDCFGYSLSYDGTFVIIGANGDDDFSGSAYILEYCCYFKWRDKVIVSGNSPYFGSSVSVDGDYAIIGATGLPSEGITGSV